MRQTELATEFNYDLQTPYLIYSFSLHHFKCEQYPHFIAEIRKACRYPPEVYLAKKLKSSSAFPGLASASNTRKCKRAEEVGEGEHQCCAWSSGFTHTSSMHMACCTKTQVKQDEGQAVPQQWHYKVHTKGQCENGTKHGIIADHFCST